MKNISIVLFLFLCASLSNPLQAQKKAKNKKVQEIEFAVNGTCGMCKERIENAVTVKGVKAASWNVDEQSLKVIYRPDKITIAEIQQFVADAGHDTEGIKATDEAYSKLHECCYYRDGATCEPKQ